MLAPSLTVKNHSTCQRRAAAAVPAVMHSVNISEQRDSESASLEEKKKWFNKRTEREREREEMAGWGEQRSLETTINIWLAVIQWTPALLSGPLEELMCSIV